MAKRLLIILVIFIWQFYIPFETKAIGIVDMIPKDGLPIVDQYPYGPLCDDKNIKITFDANGQKDLPNLAIGTNRPFSVNVKVPSSQMGEVEKSWNYYLDIVILGGLGLGPVDTGILRTIAENTSGAPGSQGSPINGSTPSDVKAGYNIYSWNFPNGLRRYGGRSDFTEFVVGFMHKEVALSPTGAVVCHGLDKQIKTIDASLADVGKCDINMSDRYQSGKPIDGSAAIKPVQGVTYRYAVVEGTPTIPHEPANPVLFDNAPGLNDKYWENVRRLDPNNPTFSFEKDLTIGTYTLAVYATSGIFPNFLAFSCGSRQFSVTKEETGPSITGGGFTPPIESGSGSSLENLTESQGGTSVNRTSIKASGVSCNVQDAKEIEFNKELRKYFLKENLHLEVKPSDVGVMTAVGCIPTQPKAFIQGILKFVTFASGGIALILMFIGAFNMVASAGNPENLKKANDQFVNAVIGLLFILFSVLLLQVIGADILDIPGFGK